MCQYICVSVCSIFLIGTKTKCFDSSISKNKKFYSEKYFFFVFIFETFNFKNWRCSIWPKHGRIANLCDRNVAVGMKKERIFVYFNQMYFLKFPSQKVEDKDIQSLQKLVSLCSSFPRENTYTCTAKMLRVSLLLLLIIACRIYFKSYLGAHIRRYWRLLMLATMNSVCGSTERIV